MQILPKAAEEPALVELLDQRCREIEDFSGRLDRCGDQLEDLLVDVFPDLDPRPLEDADASQSVNFHCRCTRERSVAALLLMGRTELADMLEKDGGAELNCHFCSSRYEVSGPELEGLIAELAAAS